MRALILSDIHANLQALEAVLAAAEGQYQQLWNLGDIVGYGANPNAVCDLIRPLSTLVVRGNHDRVSCGLTSANTFNPTARAAVLWTRTELSASNVEWLKQIPQGPLQPEGTYVSLAHGSPLDEDNYIVNMRDAWAPLRHMLTPITFFGHTHIQGGFSQKDHEWHEIRPAYQGGDVRQQAESYVHTFTPGTRHLINPGSVGQPRDHDWRAAYAIYTEAEDDQLCTIEFYRIPYDIEQSQEQIIAAGLPERLAARLSEGR